MEAPRRSKKNKEERKKGGLTKTFVKSKKRISPDIAGTSRGIQHANDKRRRLIAGRSRGKRADLVAPLKMTARKRRIINK